MVILYVICVMDCCPFKGLRLLVRVFVRFARQRALNGLLGACLLFFNRDKGDFVRGNAALGGLVLPRCDRFLRRFDCKPVDKWFKHAGMP
jgi:hypothetical protein